MSFTYVGGNRTGGKATSGSITHGLSISVGDLVVIYVHINSATTITPTQTWDANFLDDPTGQTARQQVFYKIAGSSEPSAYNFSWGSNVDYQILIKVFSSATDAVIDSSAIASIDTDTITKLNCEAIIGEVISDDALSLIFGGKDNRNPVAEAYTIADDSYVSVVGETGGQITAGAHRIYTTGIIASSSVVIETANGNDGEADYTYSIHLSFVESSVAAAEFTANLSASVATSANLLTTIEMQADQSISSVVTSNLLTSIELASSVTGSMVGISSLLTAIEFLSTIDSSVATVADLLTSIEFSTSTSATVITTSDLVLALEFLASMSVSGAITSDLQTAIELTANQNIATSVTSDLQTIIELASSMNTSVNTVSILLTAINLISSLAVSNSTTSDLLTEITLDSALNTTSNITSQLSEDAGVFTSSISLQASVAASILTAIELSAQNNITATLAGDLLTEIELWVEQNVGVTISADILTGIEFAANQSVGLETTSSLLTNIVLLTSTGISVVTAADLLVSDSALTSDTSISSSTSANLLTSIDLLSALSVSGTVSTELLTAIELASSLNMIATINGNLIISAEYGGTYNALMKFPTGSGVTITLYDPVTFNVIPLISNVVSEINNTGMYLWGNNNLVTQPTGRKEYAWVSTDGITTLEGILSVLDGFTNTDRELLTSAEKHAKYNGSVYYDSSLITGGDGTRKNPFGDQDDTIDFAEAENIVTIHCFNDVTLTRQVKNFLVTGVGASMPTINLNDQNVGGTRFYQCKVEGPYIGEIIVQEGILLGNFALRGNFEKCGIAGQLSGVDGYSFLLKNSSSLLAGFGQRPSIDMLVNGTCKGIIHGYEGGLDVLNHNKPTDALSIGMAPASVTLKNTCTDGDIVVRGIGHLVNNATVGITDEHQSVPAIVVAVWTASIASLNVVGSVGEYIAKKLLTIRKFVSELD